MRVKSDTAPRRPRYRNEAVFRSAERLIASRPARPPRKRPSRWLVFSLGIACGLSVILWWPRVREFSPVISSSPNRGEEHTAQPSPRRRASTPPVTNHPLPAPSNPAPSSSVAAPVVDTPTPHNARPASASVRQNALPARSVATPNQLAERTTAVYPVHSSLRLEGELRNPSGARLDRVRFMLHLVPGTAVAAGIVVFPDQARTNTLTLFGTWNLDSILLRADSKVPSYEFTLQFPTTSSGEFTGTWTDGRGASGPLALQLPQPAVSSRRPGNAP